MTVLAPTDAALIEVPAVRVIVQTGTDAAVAVMGEPVDVSLEGVAEYDVVLDEGPNAIHIVATDLTGMEASEAITVFYSPPASGLPLSVFYPADGVVVSEPELTVAGGSTSDAAVAVNGEPVDVNVYGIFSSEMTLEEGPNNVDITAVNLDGEEGSVSMTVFYVP